MLTIPPVSFAGGIFHSHIIGNALVMKLARNAGLAALSLVVFAGCGGDSNPAPAPLSPQEQTSVTATSAKSNVLGIVESVREALKQGDPIAELCTEMTPSFENYAALEGDANKEIYVRLLDAWKKVAGGDKAALDEVEKIANELP